MPAPPPGRVGAGVPREFADDHDTEETVVGLDAEEVEEVDSGAVTSATRVCSECSGYVLGIGVIDPPDVNTLVRIPTYWKGCVFSGPIELPCWWFCARGGNPNTKIGAGLYSETGIFGVTGICRIVVKRSITMGIGRAPTVPDRGAQS